MLRDPRLDSGRGDKGSNVCACAVCVCMECACAAAARDLGEAATSEAPHIEAAAAAAAALEEVVAVAGMPRKSQAKRPLPCASELAPRPSSCPCL